MNWIQVLSLTVLVSLIAALSGQSALYRVADVMIVAVISSLVLTRLSVRGVRVSQIVHREVAHVGDTIERRFELSSWLLLPWRRVVLGDGGSLADPSVTSTVDLHWRSTRSVSLPVVCRRRGLHDLGPARIRGSDPLGLFWTTRDVGTTAPLLVYPSTVPLPRFSLPARQGSNGELRLSDRGQSTPHVSGIREYRPGDPVHHVHWRTSARAGRLVVKEFEPERTHDVWLILDLDATVQRGVGEESTQEYGVIVAISLAQHFLGEGRKVGIVATDSRYRVLAAIGGRGQLKTALDTLAVVQPDGTKGLVDVIETQRDLWSRNAALLVITPSLDPRWLAALRLTMQRGIVGGAVVLDAATFEDTIALPALATPGVPTILVQRGIPIERSLAGGWRLF